MTTLDECCKKGWVVSVSTEESRKGEHDAIGVFPMAIIKKIGKKSITIKEGNNLIIEIPFPDDERRGLGTLYSVNLSCNGEKVYHSFKGYSL